jgi:hypothetical protein
MADNRDLSTARAAGAMPKLSGNGSAVLCGDGRWRPFADITVSGVPNTRTIATTSPLTGGGALSADLTLGISAGAMASAIQFVFDGASSALTSGMTVDIYCPFAFTITSAVLLADQSGSCSVDVRKDIYANYPPTGGDSIVASAPPTLSSSTHSKDATLTGWTTSVSADDTLQAYLSSSSTITRLTLTLYIRKS